MKFSLFFSTLFVVCAFIATGDLRAKDVDLPSMGGFSETGNISYSFDASNNIGVWSENLRVHAKEGMQPTGVYVGPGAVVTLERVSGDWLTHPHEGRNEGAGHPVKAGDEYLAPHCHVGETVAQFKGGGKDFENIFSVGTQAVFQNKSKKRAMLWLGANDEDYRNGGRQGWKDNDGYIVYRVRIQ